MTFKTYVCLCFALGIAWSISLFVPIGLAITHDQSYIVSDIVVGRPAHVGTAIENEVGLVVHGGVLYAYAMSTGDAQDDHHGENDPIRVCWTRMKSTEFVPTALGFSWTGDGVGSSKAFWELDQISVPLIVPMSLPALYGKRIWQANARRS
jgi:hypothetical protein